MNYLSKLMLSLGVVASLMSSMVPAQAQSRSGSMNPYVCDVAGGYERGDFTVGLINDNHHLVLQVQVNKADNTTYYCENAGGVCPTFGATLLQSISALVKTTDSITPADVYVEIIIRGDNTPYYFNTTAAHKGETTQDGYTEYTWRARDLQNLGLPRVAQLSKFGFSVNVYTVGTGTIRNPFLNGNRVPFAQPLVETCPFSNPALCVQ